MPQWGCLGRSTTTLRSRRSSTGRPKAEWAMFASDHCPVRAIRQRCSFGARKNPSGPAIRWERGFGFMRSSRIVKEELHSFLHFTIGRLRCLGSRHRPRLVDQRAERTEHRTLDASAPHRIIQGVIGMGTQWWQPCGVYIGSTRAGILLGDERSILSQVGQRATGGFPGKGFRT